METPVNPEDRFEAVASRLDRETRNIIEATNKETARLSFGDFAKFVEFLADKPDAKGSLRGLLEEFSGLDDDEAATEAVADARFKAKEYLEDPI